MEWELHVATRPIRREGMAISEKSIFTLPRLISNAICLPTDPLLTNYNSGSLPTAGTISAAAPLLQLRIFST